MKIIHNCTQCGKEYSRYYSNDGSTIPKTPFCSRPCKALWQSENLKGENNPNYGVSWTEDNKQKQSELVKSKVDDAYREKCATANKGKKFSKERVEKMHENRDFNSYSRPVTESAKLLIGKKSKEKFKDPEYLPRVRKTMEDRGYWIPLDQRDKYSVYADAADWICNMFHVLSLEESIVVNKVGIFHNKKNKGGFVRDHKLSRKEGFVNGIFPEILRHPCNCEFISHADNSGKSMQSSVSLQQLFEDIRNYSGDWCEHSRVIDLIESYEEGFRWDIEQFIEGRYSV